MNSWKGTLAVVALTISVFARAGGGAVEPSNKRSVYLIALHDAPLIEEVTNRLPTSPGLLSSKQLLVNRMAAPQSAAHLARLESARRGVIDSGSHMLGRSLVPTQIYTHAANGMAMELTDAEADRIAALPGVLSVRREQISHIHTDAGPQWIGATALWSGETGLATKGEGIVIGVIDTGINPTHPSFAATGADSYTHVNPRGTYLGLCASGDAICNAKLIGIYNFGDDKQNDPISFMHGSHVAAIAAGNAVAANLHGMTVDVSRNFSGVAPHANLISYRACNAFGDCFESSLIKAIDQAIVDRVDVINYSLGGVARDPYDLLSDRLSDTYALFQARAAGIVVVASVGNDGPSASTVQLPALAPWVIGVANSSHNRALNSIMNVSGSEGTSFPDFAGAGLTAAYGPAPIVYAGDYGHAQCADGKAAWPPNGSSNPWAPGTFHGEIVVCDRGDKYGWVEPGYNLKAAGAGGMILANADIDGETTHNEDHYLPAVHLGYIEGTAIKNWIRNTAPLRGSISGIKGQIDAKFADVVNRSSARGPAKFSGGVLKPDLAAPGTDILSAAHTGDGFVSRTGTSMASPQVAGSAALVLAAHPDWTPAQVESALIGTTLFGTMRKENGVTPASPSEAGGGRVQPALAAKAGLYLPLSTADLYAQNPKSGGDLRQLNRVGVESEHCLQQCSFLRTVTDMSGGGTWTISSTSIPEAGISVIPGEFTLAAGASQKLNIVINTNDPHLMGKWINGRIALRKTDGKAASDFAFIVNVYAEAGKKLPFTEINASKSSGSVILPLTELASLPRATYETTELSALGAREKVDIVGARVSALWYLDPAGPGRKFLTFSNPTDPRDTNGADAPLFIAELSTQMRVPIVVHVGIDSDGNGKPSREEEVCWDAISSDSSSPMRCIVDLRTANQRSALEGSRKANIWMVLEHQEANVTSTVYMTSKFLSHRVGKLAESSQVDVLATGPGQAQASTNFPLRLSWGAEARVGRKAALQWQRYYGAIFINPIPGVPGPMLPFALNYNNANDDQQEALSPRGMSFASRSSTFFRHAYVDVPPGARALTIDSSLSSVDQVDSSATLELIQEDYPDYSSSATVAPVSNREASAMWTLTPSTAAKSVTIPVTPGRWYIASRTGQYSRFDLIPTFAYDETASSGIAAGMYYNPERSGHGIFLNQSGNQQLLSWYTYLEDGTPTWYTAQAVLPNPAGAVWNAPLYRVNWSGDRVNSSTEVGDVILTRVNNDDIIFSWHLDGQSGSERFKRIGAGKCPEFGGTATNFNGAWYSPMQSGYGVDTLALPDQLFTTFYFYDALGIARWGVGATRALAPSNRIELTQSNGFCPACDYRKVVAQPLGTMNVDYDSAISGELSVNLSLRSPLSGAWLVDKQPLVRLTGSPLPCPH